VKETVRERDLIRFKRLMNYINVERGIMVSLNQFMKQKDVEVIPAYMLEKWIAEIAR